MVVVNVERDEDDGFDWRTLAVKVIAVGTAATVAGPVVDVFHDAPAARHFEVYAFPSHLSAHEFHTVGGSSESIPGLGDVPPVVYAIASASINVGGWSSTGL